jgi:multiple sugar transport system permease protein
MLQSRAIAFAFVAPALLFLAAILGWPLIQAVQLSLQDVRVIGSPGSFGGSANTARDSATSVFGRGGALRVFGGGPKAALHTPLALTAALVLNEKFPGVRIARTWIIITWIVPTVVVVVIWRWLFSTSGGMINPLLIQAGIIERPVGFFATPWTAMATLVFINSWRWFPFIALMILAGLTRVPGELYEAAHMDGAGAWRRFTHITWPLLAPTLGVLAVIGTLLSFNVFDIIWLLTAGGPAGGSRTLPVLIYETAFKGYRLSEAATISVLATILLMVFAVIVTRTLEKGEGR